MKQVTPAQILMLLLYVGMMSLMIMVASPGEVKITEDWAVKFPTFKDVLPKQLYIDKPSEEQQLASLGGIAEEPADISPEELWESGNQKGNKVPSGEKPINVRTKPGDKAIEYAKKEREALNNFFKGLEKVEKEGDRIRVVHFGDSQLEGDRMTERIRRNMQDQFGGCGIGLVPITEIKGIRSTLEQNASENWSTYAVYGNDSKKSTHGDFGLFGKYFTFSKTDTDTAQAFLEFKKTGYTRKKERKFEEVRLFMRNTKADVEIDYAMNNVSGKTKKLSPSEEIKTVDFNISGELGDVNMEFYSAGTPEFYGASFDCENGVAVDNVPLRGSSGTEFTKIHKAHLKKVTGLLNIKLIILQFGVNVVPQIHDSYSFYERTFYRQINYLKTLCPDASILVVGVSDMARKDGLEIQSYPNITAISGAQRRAARKAGVAFWDLYNAMGGQNSIVEWADRQPAWANKDYTHFTRKGANHVGDMLFNELMREYAKFKKKEQKAL